MLVLGLLLIIGAALITVGAIYDAGETATVEILGQTLTTTAAGVFLAGMATMLLFLIGVWALSASMGRARRKRAERRAAKRDQRDSVERLEQERAALREENERLARQLASGSDPSHERDHAGGGPVTGRQGATTHGPDATPIAPATPGRTEAGTTHPDTGTQRDALTDPTTDRMNQPADDRVVDHRTDLTAHDTTAGSGRHRDAP